MLKEMKKKPYVKKGFVSFADKEENLEKLLRIQAELLDRHARAISIQEDLLLRQERLLGTSNLDSVDAEFEFDLSPTIDKLAWVGADFELLKRLGNHDKAAFGEALVKYYLKKYEKINAEKISRGGDLSFLNTEFEVKTACLIFQKSRRCQAWSNQVRPNYRQISAIYMVVIFPDKICIYRIGKESYDFFKLSSGHSGGERTENLKEIKFYNNDGSTKFFEASLGTSFEPLHTFYKKDIKLNYLGE